MSKVNGYYSNVHHVCMCMVPGIEPRALNMLGKHSTTELYFTALDFMVMVGLKFKVKCLSFLWGKTRFSLFILISRSDSLNRPRPY